MLRHLTTTALLFSLAMSSVAPAADEATIETTVSLTTSVDREAGKAERDLMGSLLALLEVDVASRSEFSVVERRQIDLALLELALSEGLAEDSDSRLQLGKIASADLIVTLQLLKPDSGGDGRAVANDEKNVADDDASAMPDEAPQRALVRIVESLSGAIRGVSVVTIEAARLDETATQVANYLSLIDAQPERPPVTVAVTPFESLGRFDRLRPLELGLRDMVATRLRLWSDRLARGEEAVTGGEEEADDDADDRHSTPRGFRVLQRSNMQELLREFELIQSALIDQSRLPKTLPTRAAAFLVRGTIDEQNDGGTFRVIVTGELIHAASNRTVRDFQFETEPEGLEVALAHQVDVFAGRLVSSGDEVNATPGTLRERNEVDLLFGKVVSDLRRLRRIRAIDFSDREFELPGQWRASGPQIVGQNSPLRRALLRKSIDRLESTLFIRPDRTEAAYALGFCYSFHIPGIWNPARADELLRCAAASADEELRAVSLRLLAEISFHHRTGRVADGHHDRAAEQLLYAFQNMPEQHRDHLWSRLPATLESLVSKLDNKDVVLRMFDAAATAAEDSDGKHRYYLALGVRSLVGLASGRDGRALEQQLELLTRWADGDQIELRKVAAWTLGQRFEHRKEYDEAARWYRTAAESLEAGPSTFNSTLDTSYRTAAGRCLRLSGQPAAALELLEAIRPKDPRALVAGRHALEVGLCYRDLNEPEKALDVMVKAGERVRSLRDNSRLEQYVRELGGVPLDEDRDVDVTYVSGPDGKPIFLSTLATDGATLFGSNRDFRTGRHSVQAFDPATSTWTTLTDEIGELRSLAIHGSDLWAGTSDNGIWRGSKSGSGWKQWSTENGLPDNRVVTLVATETTVLAAVGTRASGGVVRINLDGSVSVLDGNDAPESAPEHLVVQGDKLLAASASRVDEMDLETDEWTRHSAIPGRGPVSVFAGRTHAWTSRYRAELAPYGGSEDEVASFSNAWFKPDPNDGRSGFLVHFVIDQGDEIWYGGTPWARFRSVGLYRFNRRTKQFHMFNLRDGFRMSTTYSMSSGIAIGDDLYLATSAGLTRVTPRATAQQQE